MYVLYLNHQVDNGKGKLGGIFDSGKLTKLERLLAIELAY